MSVSQPAAKSVGQFAIILTHFYRFHRLSYTAHRARDDSFGFQQGSYLDSIGPLSHVPTIIVCNFHGRVKLLRLNMSQYCISC